MKRWFMGSLGILLLLGLPSYGIASRFIDKYCNDPRFYCMTVKGGQSWRSLFPDPIARDIVIRLNRSNGGIWGGQRILVPKNLGQITMLDVAPMPKQIPGNGDRTIVVELSQLAWGAYDPWGNLIKWGPVSGGKGWCPDVGRCVTPTGDFKVYRKGSAGCKSRKFPIGRGGAPMPYCMFFEGGAALHGSASVPGHHASHGCVRLFTEDAKWLNQEFVTMEVPTRVIVGHY